MTAAVMLGAHASNYIAAAAPAIPAQMAASKSRQASDSQSAGRLAGAKPGVRPAAHPAMQSSSEKVGFASM